MKETWSGAVLAHLQSHQVKQAQSIQTPSKIFKDFWVRIMNVWNYWVLRSVSSGCNISQAYDLTFPLSCNCISTQGASQVALVAKKLSVQETSVLSLGQEGLLEEDTATLSSILAWRIPWAEEPGGLQSTGSPRVRHNWSKSACTHMHALPRTHWMNLLQCWYYRFGSVVK